MRLKWDDFIKWTARDTTSENTKNIWNIVGPFVGGVVGNYIYDCITDKCPDINIFPNNHDYGPPVGVEHTPNGTPHVNFGVPTQRSGN